MEYNPFSLAGKTILITGAAGGIGRATSVECAKLGATLILTDINEAGLQETQGLLEGDGHRYLVANLTSQIFGIYEHRTMAEAMAQVASRVDALEAGKEKLGNAKAGVLDVKEVTKCNAPLVLMGHGAPSASTRPVNLPEGLPWDGIPFFKGELYVNLDAASGGLYYAKGAGAVADWINA